MITLNHLTQLRPRAARPGRKEPALAPRFKTRFDLLHDGGDIRSAVNVGLLQPQGVAITPPFGMGFKHRLIGFQVFLEAFGKRINLRRGAVVKVKEVEQLFFGMLRIPLQGALHTLLHNLTRFRTLTTPIIKRKIGV